MACDDLFANVVALLHFDGADGSTTFSEVTGKTVTAYGNAQIDTAQSVFGGASLLLDGVGDFLTLPASADFDFGAGDFSIETRVRFAGWPANDGGTYVSCLVSKDTASGRSFSLNVGGNSSSFATLYFIGIDSSSASTTVTADFSFALNTDYAIECTRIGDLVYLFVDGVLLNPGGTAFSRTLDTTTTPLHIGALNYDSTYQYCLNGWLDELRITKGAGRNSANYTPATVAFGEVFCVSGTPVAPTALTVTATGASAAATDLEVVASTGAVDADTALTVTASGTAIAPSDLTIEPSTGIASAAASLAMQAAGTPVAPTALTLEASTGFAAAATALTLELARGEPLAPTALDMVATTGAPAAATALTVSWPSGRAQAATALTVTGSGGASASTLLAVIGTEHAPNWTARCMIGGVDVSAQLVGQASVTADEGAARIAQLTLLPPSGTIAPLDYVGKTISLDYVLLIGGVPVPRRLFTGRIDTPDYNPTTTLLRLDCVDDLQNRVAALDRSVIDALVGGKFSTAVQGEILDGWDYAQARLSTVAASLDAGASGGMRVTPWQGAGAWATWGAADLLYQRPRVTYPQRSTLVNRVDIEFDYRYPRLRQRYTTLGWSGTNIDMAPCGWQYPTQQDILGAAGGSGWQVTLGVFWPAPASVPHSSGGFIIPADGAIDMAVLHLTQRHGQTVTESYALTVTAPESVSANGELKHGLRGALASEFDGRAWESALDVLPLMPAGGELDWAPDAPRADADYAIQTLLDQANVKILGSHRSARVINAVLCNPELDLDKRIAISTAEMSAAGKVASVIHTLDFDAGSAISEFAIACFGAGGAGIITPDTLAPPLPPEPAAETQAWPSEVPPLFVNTYGVTPYNEALGGLLLNPPETIAVENIPGVGNQGLPNPFYVAGAGSYPVTGFRVSMPGVDDADRNPLEKPVAASYQQRIPADTLSFTIP